MGDQFGGQQPAPNADPSTGLGTQAAAAAMPQQGGLTGTLSNPLVQMLLGTYAGAVGSPRQEGLGGAIKGGITGGLSLFDKARQQQMQIPLQQAQLKEAQLQAQKLGMDLRPLNKDEIQSITDWKNALQARLQDPKQRDMVDPYEISYVNQLESQARGGQITSQQLLASMEKFHESALIQAMFKPHQAAASDAMIRKMNPDLFPPDQSSDQSQGQGQPPPGQQQGQQPPPAEAKPNPYHTMQWPAVGSARKMDVPGIGNNVVVKTQPGGHVIYLDPKTNTWANVPPSPPGM